MDDLGKLVLFNDQPLFMQVAAEKDLLAEDKFGHEVYARTIIQILTDNLKSMRIALLGSWGIGKSSVMNLLMKELEKSDKNCVIYFNAWKHSGDSFRRQLLISAAKKIYGQGTPNYKEMIDLTGITISKAEGYDDKITYRQAFKDFFSSIFNNTRSAKLIHVTGFFVILLWILLKIVEPYSSDTKWLTLITDIIWIPILIFIFSIFEKATKHNLYATFKITQPTIDKPLLSYPEQFEEKFRECINSKCNKKVDKFIIIVDDLDRCGYDIVIEALSVIKQFSVDKCTFIVPCDEEQVIRAISKENGHDYKYESLRKYFDAIIRMDGILENDLADLATELIETYSLKPKIAEIILYSGAKDARKIKSFINTFRTKCWIIKERINQGSINDNFLEDNLLLIAKITAIQEQFIDFYRELQKNPRLLDAAQGLAKNTKFVEQLDKDENAPLLHTILRNNEELLRFLQITEDISTENIYDVIGGKLPEYTRNIINGTQIISCLFGRKNNEFLNIISQTEPENALQIANFISKKIDEQIKYGLYIQLESFLSCCVSVFENKTWERQEFSYARTLLAETLSDKYFLIPTKISSKYYFNLEFLESLLHSLNNTENLQKIIINKLNVNEGNNLLLSLISLINRNAELLSDLSREAENLLAELNIADEKRFLQLLDLLKDNSERDLIPSSSVINIIIKSLSNADDQQANNQIRYNLLRKYRYLVEQKTLIDNWIQLSSVARTTSIPFDEAASLLYKLLLDFIADTDSELINGDIADTLFDIWTHNPKNEHRKHLFEILIIAYPQYDETNRNKTHNKIKEWIVDKNSDAIILILNEIIKRINESKSEIIIQGYTELNSFILDHIVDKFHDHAQSAYHDRLNDLIDVLTNFKTYIRDYDNLEDTIIKIVNSNNDSTITNWLNGTMRELCSLLPTASKKRIESLIIEKLKQPFPENLKTTYIELLVDSISAHPRKILPQNADLIFQLIRSDEPTICVPLVKKFSSIKDRIGNKHIVRNMNILVEYIKDYSVKTIEAKYYLIELLVIEFENLSIDKKQILAAKIPTIIQSTNKDRLIMSGLQLIEKFDKDLFTDDIISALDSLASHSNDEISQLAIKIIEDNGIDLE